MSRQTLEKIILCVLFVIAFYNLIHYNLINHNPEHQFEALAQSFLHGNLYLGLDNGQWADASYYKGYAYWPQGMFPALLLMPFFAILGSLMREAYLQFVLNLLNIFLLYKIADKITKNKITALWLSFGYLFATAYLPIGLVPWSWWFAQVVATTALLLSLYEYFYTKRWVLIGIYIACAFLTRVDLIFSLVFFASSILLQKDIKRDLKAYELVSLFFPIMVGVLSLILYNYLRFGSVLEFGYKYHIPELAAARGMFHTYGTWNLIYYPTNLYYLFLRGFDEVQIAGTGYLTYPYIIPDMWGLSIFITSPLFIWCFKKIKETIKKAPVLLSLLTSIFMLLFILGYFGVGTRQYGYRYALDFYPFLFIMLCFALSQGLGKVVKLLIIASFFINLYFFPMIFGN